MASDDKVQRVKIVGPLYLFKTWLGIIRDLLLIAFLIVGIFGIFVAVAAFQEISPVVGALKNGDLGSLIRGSVGAAISGDPQAVLLDKLSAIETYYYDQDTARALAGVQELESLAKSIGASAQDMAPLQELKKAISEKDDAKFSLLMDEIRSSLK